MNDAIQRLLNDSKANTLPTQDRTATNDRESFGADFGLPRRDESRLLNLIAERILNPREQRELSIEESKRVVSEQIYDILLEQNRKLSEDHWRLIGSTGTSL
jgi:hypothetical protein